jgi:hypothetical protein
MEEKLVDMQEQKDQSYKNMQNPDFLWEIPDNGTQQHLVRQVQEVRGSREDTRDNKNSKK